ncbi:MAG: TIR domain-containing protein [Dehalococcoidales bacterium]|nr:TIR domain-containing protein [Dehalococcoidales bacterium]
MSYQTRATRQPLTVFVSYDRTKDQLYRNYFDSLFADNKDIAILNSVQIGEMGENSKPEALRQKIRDEYLLDSTVTVVLVGADTWSYKHVDWEIGSSLRDARYNSRSGLLGIVLPSYPRLENDRYDPHTLPPRLNANIRDGYAQLHNWAYDAAAVSQWIQEADERRDKIVPDNTFPSFTNNLSGSKWHE